MKITKNLVAGCLTAFMITAIPITTFAATYDTPAEAAAGVTGKTVEEVIELRQDGTTYGEIAAEAGKLEEFQQAMQEIFKEALDAGVADGSLTQAQADELLAARKARQAICDGDGNGAGRCSRGTGRGMSNGRGMGNGRGVQNGICIYQ